MIANIEFKFKKFSSNMIIIAGENITPAMMIIGNNVWGLSDFNVGSGSPTSSKVHL